MAKIDDFSEYNCAYLDAQLLVEVSENHYRVALGTVRSLRREIDKLTDRELKSSSARARSRARAQRLRLSAQLWGFCEGYQACTGIDLRKVSNDLYPETSSPYP